MYMAATILLPTVSLCFITLFIIMSSIESVTGHGHMSVPPMRSSMWHYDPMAPKNYDENALLCGGSTRSTVSDI